MQSAVTENWEFVSATRSGSVVARWLVKMLNAAVGNEPRRQRVRFRLLSSDEDGRTNEIQALILDPSLTAYVLQDVAQLLWRASNLLAKVPETERSI